MEWLPVMLARRSRSQVQDSANSSDDAREPGVSGSGAEREPPRGRLEGKALTAGIGLIGAMLGGLITLLTGIVPIISPWFQEHVFPPTKSVSISSICIESGVARKHYFDSFGRDYSRRFENEDPNLRGFLVGVAVTLNGFDGETLTLHSNVLNATSGAVAIDQSLQDVAEVRTIEPDAATVMRDPQVWVPPPPSSGRFIIEMRVIEQTQGGSLGLASGYSRAFTQARNGTVHLSGLCAG